MQFERVNSDVPPQLYHVTERANLQSIMQKGLCNEKTLMVFLTYSDKYVSYIIKKRKYRNPVFLRIDAEQMHKNGYSFFKDEAYPLVLVTQNVPWEYISVEEY